MNINIQHHFIRFDIKSGMIIIYWLFFQIHHNQSSSCALIVVDMCPDRFQLGEYQQAHADCKANLELFMFFGN